MHGILLIVFLFISYAKSSDFIKHLDPGDSSKRGSISYNIPQTVPFLIDIALKAVITYIQEKKIPYADLPKDLKDRYKKTLADLYGSLWFELFGNAYKPENLVLEESGTKISPDRRYLFVYKNKRTKVYQLKDIIPQRPAEIPGEFCSVTIDSTLIMVRVDGGFDFYALPALELFKSYRGPFENWLDAILLSEDKKLLFLEKALDHREYESRIYEEEYEILSKHLNWYIFSTMDIAYKVELLFWGDSEYRAYSVPRIMMMIDNGPYAFVRTMFESSDSKAAGLYLFDFEKKEKIVALPKMCCEDERNALVQQKVRQKNCASTICKDTYYGRFKPFASVVSNNGQFLVVASIVTGSIFLFDTSHLNRYTHEDLMRLEHMAAYYNPGITSPEQNSISQLAVSNDGLKIISVSDDAALRRQDLLACPFFLGIDGNIADSDNVFVRIHFFNKKGITYVRGSTILVKKVLKKDEIIRRVGFNKESSKFFILSNKTYSLYTIADLIPDSLKEMLVIEPFMQKFLEKGRLDDKERSALEAESIQDKALKLILTKLIGV